MADTVSTSDAARPAKPFEPVPLGTRLATIVGITIPILGLAAAAVFLLGWGPHWADLALLVGMYLLTATGITVGFHRLFVHRSFETYLGVKVVLAALGSMAIQGSLFQWVGTHRLHHRHSDTPDDPHSPHHHGTGLAGLFAGVWHSHIGWFFTPTPPDMDHYVKDLSASPTLRWVDRLFPVWVALGLLVPAVLGGASSGTWAGALTGFLWGGLVRVLVVHHLTWSANSACHLWGMRPFESGDESRNNFVFGVLTLGEGWHNAHHAFPTSARHGLRWWEPDASYWVIRALALAGLAWNLKLPSRKAQVDKRR